MNLERKLHRLARLVGDLRAARRGRLPTRLARRAIWKQWAKLGRRVLP